MLEERRRRRAIARVEVGDGRPLRPFRWWQPLSRAVFHLAWNDEAGRPVTYVVDVPYWQRAVTADGNGRAHLYLDGRHHARSTLPAVFPVPGGAIEVVGSSFGLRRCHLVAAADGSERALTPDPRSAEGRRARVERERPALSRLIAWLSVLLLLVPILLAVPQVAEAVSRIPPVSERTGVLDSPVDLAWWHNALLALCASVASVERATRLQFSALLDGPD